MVNDEDAQARLAWKQALAASPIAWETDTDEAWDGIWKLIHALRTLGRETLLDDLLASLASREPWERMLGARVLAEYGYEQGRPFARRVTPHLVAAASTESDADVRASLVMAIGWCEDASWAPELRAYASDPSPDVRFEVACCLPYVFAGEDMDPPSIATLIHLTTDDDPRVRDWATFALGTQSDLDTPDIRAALRARLDDEERDEEIVTDAEALVGLAKRHDPVVLPYLRTLLTAGPDVVGNLTIEAAGLYGDRGSCHDWWSCSRPAGLTTTSVRM